MQLPVKHSIATLWIAVYAGFAAPASAAEDNSFAEVVVPFLRNNCTDCHGDEDPEGDVSLARFEDSANATQEGDLWRTVLRVLKERQMPPEDEPQPTEKERATAIAGIQFVLSVKNCDSEQHPGRVTLRRLNRAEYNNTIRDLVGVDFQPADDFPSDDVGNGFDNMGDVLTMPPLLLEKYLDAADQIVERAFRDEKARGRISPLNPATAAEKVKFARKNLRQFASRAIRRPITDEEIARVFAIVSRAKQSGSAWDEAYRMGFKAILVSPSFLFRVERDPDQDDEDGIRSLDDFELATRLSYFLWSSMPDDELFELARQDQLHDSDVLDQQVRRMLQDKKSRALVDNFAGQWLQLRDIPKLTPDESAFRDFDEDLRAAMRRETEMFFANIMDQDRSILEFLNADYTFVNQRLARHYGMESIRGDDFQRVQLGQGRRGVLTQAAILFLTSNPGRTSPVKRGKWILDNFLGEPPPPPPDGVTPLDEEADELGSLRERMEQHRSNESCAICHRKMDALGFGLENFDAIGAWRDRDGKFDIDASGSLPGGLDFKGPAELMDLLVKEKREEFTRCMTKKLLTYALGRGLESFDDCAVDKVLKELAANDYRFSSLVLAIVHSDPFQMREANGEE